MPDTFAGHAHGELDVIGSALRCDRHRDWNRYRNRSWERYWTQLKAYSAWDRTFWLKSTWIR